MDIKFRIDEKKEIIISIQDDISCLSKSSDATVYLKNADGIKHMLAEDIFVEIISVFNNVLLKAIKGEVVLNELNSIGYIWNDWANNLPDEGGGEKDIYDELWIWSTKETGTWLYKLDDKNIILEISPIYRWLFEEPDNKDFVSFEEFIRDYKVVLQQKMDINSVINWQTVCQSYINKFCN